MTMSRHHLEVAAGPLWICDHCARMNERGRLYCDDACRDAHCRAMGRRLEAVRVKILKLSAAEMAAKLDIPTRYYRPWERGQRRNWTVLWLHALRHQIPLSLDFLMRGGCHALLSEYEAQRWFDHLRKQDEERQAA
jgi:hypothetical protein